jgi:hypothetical protein
MKLLSSLFPLCTRLGFCVVTICICSSFASANNPSMDDQAATNAQLLQEMKMLAEKVSTLEERLSRYEKEAGRRGNADGDAKAKTDKHDKVPASAATAVAVNRDTVVVPNDRDLFGLGYRSNALLSIGAYGELKFGGQEAPGGWQNGFDASRIVLLPTFQITDSITFNAELEFEHGGIAEDDELACTRATVVDLRVAGCPKRRRGSRRGGWPCSRRWPARPSAGRSCVCARSGRGRGRPRGRPRRRGRPASVDRFRLMRGARPMLIADYGLWSDFAPGRDPESYVEDAHGVNPATCDLYAIAAEFHGDGGIGRFLPVAEAIGREPLEIFILNTPEPADARS